MKFNNAYLEAIDYVLPPNVITSDVIENKLSKLYEKLNLPKGRLEMMTGIKERRYWAPPMLPSQIAAQAARNVLSRSAIRLSEIDLLIFSGVCRDKIEPSTAAYVHSLLNLSSKTQIFDLSNACLGFLNAMLLAANMLESKQLNSALIVSGENGYPLLQNTLKALLEKELTRKEIKPYFANLTIGSGGAAAIITGKKYKKSALAQITSSEGRSNTKTVHLCEGDFEKESSQISMQTDSEALLKAGVELAQETWAAFKDLNGWHERSPHKIICHQVGKQHQLALYNSLRLDVSKDYSTYPYLGNTGSVALPITLAKAIEEKAIKPSDLVALLGIGSGLSCTMVALAF